MAKGLACCGQTVSVADGQGPDPGNAPFAEVFRTVPWAPLARAEAENWPNPARRRGLARRDCGSYAYRALVGLASIGLNRENRSDSRHVRSADLRHGQRPTDEREGE